MANTDRMDALACAGRRDAAAARRVAAAREVSVESLCRDFVMVPCKQALLVA